MFGKRILILVPHPDDEVVGCAAALGRARAEGAAIFALYLTHGCIERDVMWPWQRPFYDRHVARRFAEADAVARFLGIKQIGWQLRPARHLWRDMAAVQAEIQAAITAHAIDQLWVPAYEGGNPDHDALNAVASKISGVGFLNGSPPLAGGIKGGLVNVSTPVSQPPPSPPASGVGALPPILEFAEYNFSGGKAQAQCFPQPNGTEQVIALTEAERATKRAALALYKSEKANLNYVGVERECYRPLATYDYTVPPHKGTLWYSRFQWVPFRHPRVDFTNPMEVSVAISEFLQRAR